MMCDFASGSPSLLAKDLVREATMEMLRIDENLEGEKHPLSYGVPGGDPVFLNILASWLTSMYGRETKREDLMITAGASHGLDLVLGTIGAEQKSRSRFLVFVENPTYFKAIKTIRDRLCEVVAVETDDEGIIPSSLRRTVMNSEFDVAALYVIPTFSNPRGGTLSEKRRVEILQICIENGVKFVIEDDPYSMLSVRSRSIKRLVEIPSHEIVVFSLGSFSKIVAPGLRCGWIETRSKYWNQNLRDNGVLSSGGCISHFTSRILQTAIQRRDLLTGHVKMLRREYLRRGELMYSELSKHIQDVDENIIIRKPSGGVFIWISLPEHLDANVLLKRCTNSREGFSPVKFRCGNLFSPSGDFRHCFRVSFSKMDDSRIIEGSRRLGHELQIMNNEISSGSPSFSSRL